jgi:phospholipid transport system substrate-binding protein
MLKGYGHRLLLSCCTASILFLIALHAWGGAELALNNPYRLMHQVSDRIFEKINSESQASHNAHYFQEIVRQELMPFVHIRYTGALILGPLFNTLDDKQQQRYFQALEAYLEQSYAKVLESYRYHSYQIEPEKPFENRTIVTVRLNILQPGSTPLKIDFKWRKNSKDQQWQVYDLLVEGVSLIATKQQEWSTLLRQSGFDALIEQLCKPDQQSVAPGKASH